jgi:TamB, inner membrane protein subunit of TAM complex
MSKLKHYNRIKKLRKIIVRGFVILVLLLITIIIIFSIPSVQTYVAKKVTDNLNETYGTDINIGRLGLNWKGEVDIRTVLINDHHADTLIYAKELQTNIISFRNLIAGDLGFGNINLETAKLYVTTYKGEERDNLSIFAEKFNTESQQEVKPFSMFSNDVELNNSTVKIVNENLDTPTVLFLKQVNLAANDFKITGVDVDANIQSLSLDAERGFSIKDAKADFSYTAEAMRIIDLTLKTEKSTIIGDLVFTYGENGLGDFIDGVTITATFNETKIATDDINAWYNEFGPDQIINVDGTFEGTMNNFTFSDTDISSEGSQIEGTFTLQNLLNDEEFSIKADNHSIQTSYYELRRFMPRILGDVLPVQLKDLGGVSFQGNTTITQTQLITNSNVSTAVGSANLDLEMSNYTDPTRASYAGSAVLDRFNLGKLAGTTSLGKVTANLTFNGRGFSQETLNTEVKGQISSFTFEGYTYKNIKVEGLLKNPIFDGNLVIDDPNLKMEFTGLVDVSKDYNQFDFEADIEYAELNNLNLFKRDSVSVFAGRVVMDMDGTTINDAEGTIEFTQTFYQTAERDFYFNDFLITSSFDGPVRTIQIQSPDIINGKISGEFLLEDIPNLFQNSIASIYTNYIPAEVTTNQYLNYEFEVFNKIVDVFVPELQLGNNTKIKGSVASDESKFQLDFKSPELLAFKNYFGNVEVLVDNDNPLFNTYVSIDSVYTGVYNVTDLSLINKTIKDTLFIRSEFKGGTDKEDLFNLSLYHTINPEGKSVVGVKKSDITYKDNVWYLNEENNNLNKVTFDDNFSTVKIDSLVLNHNNEYIQLAGVLRDSTYKDIKAEFRDVNIGNIVPPIDSLRLKGNVNGTLNFLQKNGAYYPNSTVTIDGIEINDIAFGDLNLDVRGNESLSNYTINTTLTNEGVKSINARGEIDVSKDNPRINLLVDLNEFNMQAFSPFGGEVVTDIRGLISGNARVSGNYKSPDILGRFNLQGSGLRVPYLNTDFDIEDGTQIEVTKNKFEIGATTITDTKYNTEGTLSGFAGHTNFSEWELDLNITTDNLLALNTPKSEDALYYGTAFISGTTDITGPVDELTISVEATTQPNTSFKIPISDTQSLGEDTFITFLSPAEKEAIEKGEEIEEKEVKGLKLNFDLDITKDAEVEVVVDQENNSKLTGRGVGILYIEINTLGKFKMWGEYTVLEGVFDFRYGGLIQRKIGIVPGGFIVWEGNPERGKINLTAKYETEANPSVLIDNPSVNRKIPVTVLVDLKGELIQPEIDFRIEFPKTTSTVRSELEYKIQNREQRERQALFLVASDQFVNDDFGGAGAFTGTLVDRVSGLVNQLFTDKNSKYSVGLDYSPASGLPNQQAAGQVGLTFSADVTERILINGKVGVPVGGANESTVAGDVEVQWLVNEDGSLRINFFNRQANIQFIGESQIFEQGAGVSYSVDFDTFKELMAKLFNKKITLEDESDLPVTPDDSGMPIDFNNDGVIDENDNY